jgi:CDP-diacylglycerol--glycerol-3-phosphate 3-phosphatidyltransferase
VATIIDHGWHEWHWGWFVVPVDLIAVVGIYYVAVVSTVSAVDYFVAFWKKIDRASSTARKRENEFVLSRKKKDLPPAARNVT